MGTNALLATPVMSEILPTTITTFSFSPPPPQPRHSPLTMARIMRQDATTVTHLCFISTPPYATAIALSTTLTSQRIDHCPLPLAPASCCPSSHVSKPP